MRPPYEPQACLGPLAPAMRTVVVPDGTKTLSLAQNVVGTYVDVKLAVKPGRALVVSMPDGRIRATLGGNAASFVTLTHERGTERYIFPREVTMVEVLITETTPVLPAGSLTVTAWIEDLASFANASARAGGEADVG